MTPTCGEVDAGIPTPDAGTPRDAGMGAALDVDATVEVGATDGGSSDAGESAGPFLDAAVDHADGGAPAPELALLGSRGCAAAPSHPSAWWWLWLPFALRRRRATVGVLLLVGLLGVPDGARAQVRLERLDLAPSGSLSVRDARASDERASVRLDVSYARDPLRVVRVERARPTVTRVVSDALSAQLTGDLRLARQAALSIALPMTWWLGGHRDQSFDLGPGGGGVGDLRLALRGALAAGPLALGAELTWALPTARGGTFVGAGRHALEARALGSWSDGRVRLLANLGFRGARAQELGSSRLGSELIAGLAIVAQASSWSLGAELDGATGLRAGARLRRATTSLEARAFVERDLGLVGRPRLGLGVGLVDGWGTPSWRAILGWSFRFGSGATRSNTRPLLVDARATRRDARGGDRDGDGIPDARDRCLTLAEDHDGILDADGCPEAAPARRLAPREACVEAHLVAHFAIDADDLSPRAARTLRDALTPLRDLRFSVLRLVGHTDDRADHDHNDALSARRIDAVYALIREELDALPRVTRWPRGEREPSPTGVDAVARARNRRVEIHFACR